MLWQEERHHHQFVFARELVVQRIECFRQSECEGQWSEDEPRFHAKGHRETGPVTALLIDSRTMRQQEN